MPGILPMKVIKVGTNAQARIAQACDRCRSKKIRCDGVRPCCSQCANVGFECKTSDKLSRRAFPRGYTESLEERVRALELEVRNLKDLLDEKDEKLDILSRLQSQSTHPIQLPSPRRTSSTSTTSKDARERTPEKEDMFKVQQSPYLLDEEGSDSYFAGTSSSRTFIEAFKHKMQEKGRSTDSVDTEKLLATSLSKRTPDGTMNPTLQVTWKAPPRMVSDKLVNVFFQEWAPLFPVLHRPSFLVLYEKYVADPDTVTDRAELAQLNLVFGIAALSGGARLSEDLESFEIQWKAAVDSILTDSSMQTLQALVLAQIYCVQQGDLTRLLSYKGLSTTLSARLGLHQSQKRFALGTLTCETRKKVFWTLYTVDCFTAVTLGLPKHLKDDDVHCEFPADVDDEYISERGFQPCLPGESTKLSSSLALFRAAQILSKVLEEVFPAKTTYDLSLKKLSDLLDELDEWSNSLSPHLRLQFALDKPSTGTINSRSPLLSLTYHYIRALIQRPAVCASLGRRSSSSMLALAGSCKHMIQILQLLHERGLSFSFCLNRDELLVLSGFGLLFQGLNLEPNSKILKDNQKMLGVAKDLLDRSEAPCAPEFGRALVLCGPNVQVSPTNSTPSLPRQNSDSVTSGTTTQSDSAQSSPKKQFKAFASCFSAVNTPKRPGDATDGRRATVHNISLHPHMNSASRGPSLQPPSAHDSSATARSEPARSPVHMLSRPNSTTQPSVPPQQSKARPRPRPQLTNLDYLSFNNGPETPVSQASNSAAEPIKTEPGPTDWERLLGSLDNGATSIYNATYGGQSVDHLLLDAPAPLGRNGLPLQSNNGTLGSDISWSNPDLWSLCQTDTNTSAHTALTTGSSGPAGSVMSFSSDEVPSRHSGEDFGADWSGGGGENAGLCTSSSGAGENSFRAIVLPELGQGEDLGFAHAWDGGLSL